MGSKKSTAKRGIGKKRTFSELMKDGASGLTVAQIEERVGDTDPAPIRTKFVVVNGRRYPPLQVMDLVLGKRKGIASATAQRRLQRLGLVAGRVGRSATKRRSATTGRHVARRRAPRAGKLVTAAKEDVQRTFAPTPPPAVSPSSKTSVSTDARAAFEAELRAHVGEWVATRGDKLLTAAVEAKTVVAWLNEHDERADMMYKVPRDLSEVSGSAA